MKFIRWFAPVVLILASLCAISAAAHAQTATANLPEAGESTFAELGIPQLELDRSNPTASWPVLMAPAMAESKELNYILALDLEVGWASSDSGRVLLSASVNDQTNIQVEMAFDATGMRYEALDRVVGVTASEHGAGPTTVVAQNYLRTASRQLESGTLQVKAEFLDGAEGQTVSVLPSSSFEVSGIPIDPVTLALVGETDITVDDSISTLVIPYELTIADGRSVESATVFGFVEPNRGSSDSDSFEVVTGAVQGQLEVELPSSGGPHTVIVAANTPLSSPSLTLMVQDAVEGSPWWTARGLATIVGSALIVGVPLRWLLTRRARGTSTRLPDV